MGSLITSIVDLECHYCDAECRVNVKGSVIELEGWRMVDHPDKQQCFDMLIVCPDCL